MEYELMGENNGRRYSYSWWRIALLVTLSLSTTALVYLTWSSAYNETYEYPPNPSMVPDWWYRRAHAYANSVRDPADILHDFRLMKNQSTRSRPQQQVNTDATNEPFQQHVEEQISDNAIYASSLTPDNQQRLVCYYTIPNPSTTFNDLRLKDVDAQLCTHINIGVADIYNSTLVLSDDLARVLREEAPELRLKNAALKLLLWVGSGDPGNGFAAMIKNHSTRKIFIQSLKQLIRQYSLDGVDLDWEFPSAYNKERQHFSQLLYEIRQEYIRERRNYLLTVAVAAPEGIALFAYDVTEINKYADFANLMTYDYHFYSRGTPFTGLNAPLYARSMEHSILATLNINYSVNWWLTNGLDRNKLVVGLPTYGHSFTLVNPFNRRIGAPAESMGQCGSKGFTTYSELCWFNTHNLGASITYDHETCSPFLSCGSEWISFENEKSMECKTNFVKAAKLGGVMVFSLNTDDYKNLCYPKRYTLRNKQKANATFPLIATVKKILWSNE